MATTVSHVGTSIVLMLMPGLPPPILTRQWAGGLRACVLVRARRFIVP